jgi:hypothetical protein
MTMTFDVLRFVGLLAFRNAMPSPLFWISLVVAGLGLFAPRLSDHGVYSPPRR